MRLYEVPPPQRNAHVTPAKLQSILSISNIIMQAGIELKKNGRPHVMERKPLFDFSDYLNAVLCNQNNVQCSYWYRSAGDRIEQG